MNPEEANIEVDARDAWGESRNNIPRVFLKNRIPDAALESLTCEAAAISKKEESSGISFLYFIPSGLLIFIFWPLSQILAVAGIHSGSSLIDRSVIYLMMFCWAAYPILWILAFSFSLIAYGLDWPPKLFKKLCTLPLLFSVIPYLLIILCALIRRMFE